MAVDPDIVPLLDALETRIAALEAGLPGLTTDAEYQAALSQIAALDARIAVLEGGLVVPPPPPPPSPGEIVVEPGVHLWTVAEASPPNSIFRLSAGVHYTDCEPKPGMVFIGDPGAVMDGRNSRPWAFQTDRHQAHNVTVSNLEIRNYASGYQQAAVILAAPHGVVSDCWVHHNGAVGVQLGSESSALRLRATHNGHLGLKILDSARSVVAGCELDENNRALVDPGNNEAGGLKALRCRNLIVRGTKARRNHGPGLWTDYECYDVTYEDNLVADNMLDMPGIFHEVSGAAVIRRNVLRGGGGIAFHDSENVEVYENDLDVTRKGIGAVSSGRPDRHPVRNCYVHHNQIKYREHWSGIFRTDAPDNPYIATANNRWRDNTYDLTQWGGGEGPFRWASGYLGLTAWRAAGQDA